MVTLLEVSEKEVGIVALHLPIGSLKTDHGWSRYQDANPVPTSQLADDIATTPRDTFFLISVFVIYNFLERPPSRVFPASVASSCSEWDK